MEDDRIKKPDADIVIGNKKVLSVGRMEGRKEMFNLATHSKHFIIGCMALDIWTTTIQIVREETHCHHLIGYSFQLAARDLLYAPSHRWIVIPWPLLHL